MLAVFVLVWLVKVGMGIKWLKAVLLPLGDLLKMLSLNQWVWDGPLVSAFLMRRCQCCKATDHTLNSKTLLRPFFTKERGMAVGRRVWDWAQFGKSS